MEKALFLRRGAVESLIDPHKLLSDYGWEVVRGDHHPGFMIWRKSGKPGNLFLYEGGEWHLMDNGRRILQSGPSLESLQAYLSGDIKPLEHMG